MRTWLVGVGLVALCVVPGGVARAEVAGVEVTLSQSRVSTSVGRVVALESRIVNRGASASGPMLAHVNVASADGGYVDLEDWSADVTQRVEALEPGADTSLHWELQAVNAGNFHVYVVLLPEEGPLIASGDARVEVGEKRNLNAGGVLPVAIAVPVILGFVAVVIRVRVRRRTV